MTAHYEYTRHAGRLCESYGSPFNSLLEAKDECNKNSQCTGVYDVCGDGTRVYACTGTETFESGCNSIMYRKVTTGKIEQL